MKVLALTALHIIIILKRAFKTAQSFQKLEAFRKEERGENPLNKN